MNKQPPMNRKPCDAELGFSLVEMAIVLAIVALLMAGMLPMLSGQIEQGRRSETRKMLAEIQQALFGYAVINNRLPCPTTVTDPSNASYGLEAANCSGAPTEEGYLPWKTLGLTETDAWGAKRSNNLSPWTGYWRYRVDRNFANSGVPVTLTTGFSADKLSVIDRANNLLTPATAGCTATPTSECPIAIVFSTGPDLAGNGENNAPTEFEAAGGTYQSDDQGLLPDNSNFDDILIWVSRPQLLNRLVAAGKLP
jgi:prepilin-type N-terminal cleavage/methylation domain-containing protein